MERRTLMKVVVLSMVGLLLPLLVCDSARAQKRGRSSTPSGNGVVVGDWRYPELVGKEDGDDIDVGDGFKAEHFDRAGNSLTVNIPGAYSDTLKVGGHGPDLTHKLAAAVFVKVMAAPTTNAEEALQKYYLGDKDVRNGYGQVETHHLFRLSNGRTARIFVYYNERYGLLGIVRTGPASGKK
jgi:hypothetical protein